MAHRYRLEDFEVNSVHWSLIQNLFIVLSNGMTGEWFKNIIRLRC